MPVNIPIRTFNDITTESRRYLTDNSDIKTLNRTSTAKLLLDAVAFEQESMYDFQRSQFLNVYLSTSTGSSLDEIGFLFNVNRTESRKATDTSTSNFRFYIDPIYGKNVRAMLEEFYTSAERQNLIATGFSTDGTNLIIPVSIRVTNLNETITYYTNSVVNMEAGNSEGYAQVMAESNGSLYNVSSNVLARHNLNDYPELRKIANLISCENKFGISNGGDYEDDENYRWRISNKVVANAGSNEAAIRLAALSVPGVRSISIVPKAYGTGTFRVFVEGIDPIVSDGLLSAVQESIMRVASIGENVYIASPNYVGIEIQVQLLFDYNANRNLLKESARTIIIDYVNNLELGGEIIINEIIQRVMDISEQIKDMNITLFGYGDYNKYTEVNENYVPLRLTNQKATWQEKFYTNNKLCSICEYGALN